MISLLLQLGFLVASTGGEIRTAAGDFVAGRVSVPDVEPSGLMGRALLSWETGVGTVHRFAELREGRLFIVDGPSEGEPRLAYLELEGQQARVKNEGAKLGEGPEGVFHAIVSHSATVVVSGGSEGETVSVLRLHQKAGFGMLHPGKLQGELLELPQDATGRIHVPVPDGPLHSSAYVQVRSSPWRRISLDYWGEGESEVDASTTAGAVRVELDSAAEPMRRRGAVGAIVLYEAQSRLPYAAQEIDDQSRYCRFTGVSPGAYLAGYEPRGWEASLCTSTPSGRELTVFPDKETKLLIRPEERQAEYPTIATGLVAVPDRWSEGALGLSLSGQIPRAGLARIGPEAMRLLCESPRVLAFETNYDAAGYHYATVNPIGFCWAGQDGVFGACDLPEPALLELRFLCGAHEESPDDVRWEFLARVDRVSPGREVVSVEREWARVLVPRGSIRVYASHREYPPIVKDILVEDLYHQETLAFSPACGLDIEVESNGRRLLTNRWSKLLRISDLESGRSIIPLKTAGISLQELRVWLPPGDYSVTLIDPLGIGDARRSFTVAVEGFVSVLLKPD